MQKSLFSIIILFCSLNIFAQGTDFNLSEEENLYTKVENIEIQTTQGETFNLSQLYEREPLILALVFTRCTGVCSPLISNLRENLHRLDSKDKYKVLVVSFDTADSKRDVEYYSKLFKLDNNKKWVWGITEQIDEMIESVGFFPEWDSVSRQFEHDALLVGINGNGYIKKKLIGIRDPRAVENMIKSINNEFIVSYPLPRYSNVFSCFTYDPVTGKKKMSFGLLLLIVPAIGTIALVTVLVRMNKKKTS